METDKLKQIAAAVRAFIQTKGRDESIAAMLPADTEFPRRLHNLNHFRTAFAWSLEDWIFEQYAGDEQWEDLAEALSWADDGWTEARWQQFFTDLAQMMATNRSPVQALTPSEVQSLREDLKQSVDQARNIIAEMSAK